MELRDPLIKVGRPRLELDYALVLRLRDEGHLGWTRGAEEYRKITGLWVSRDTFKRRYLVAKAASNPSKSWADEFAEELQRRLKERWLNQ